MAQHPRLGKSRRGQRGAMSVASVFWKTELPAGNSIRRHFTPSTTASPRPYASVRATLTAAGIECLSKETFRL